MGLMTQISLSTDPADARRIFGDPAAARATPRGWDVLASCPVPLRSRLRDDIAHIVQRRQTQDDPPLKCCVPMGQGGRTPMERLRYVRALEDFPKLLISAENGNAFNRAFHAAHVERGAFAAGQPAGAPGAFVDAGLIDPKGWIGVYAVAPFVMLIDRDRLGHRPVPQSWTELRDPRYRGEVVFSGWRRPGASNWSSYNLLFLLAIQRLMGEAGLADVLANTATLAHSAQMPRLAGSGASVGAIYILPWALADLCPRRDCTEIVWPQEGALAFPLWLTMQAAHHARVRPLIDYLFSSTAADWLDRNRYPSLAPDRDARLPAGARFYFPGWDYLRHRAASRDLKRAVALFGESCRSIENREWRCAS